MDDSHAVPFGCRFDVSKARGMRDHKLKVLVLRREVEVAGFVGLDAGSVCFIIIDVAVLDADL